MCDLVGKPQRDQFRVEAQTLGFGIRYAGEMLEADESDSFTLDHELTGVRGTDANHEHHIDVRVYVEEGPALLFRVSGERDDIDSLQHRAKVYTTCKCGRANDFQKMRPCRIQHVVVPVGL